MVTNRKLKLVVENSQPRTGTKWQGLDNIFIHRSQIELGTKLLNFGRLDHDSIWEVQTIFSVFENSGRRKYLDNVDKLHDQIVLKRIGSNETRQMTFVYLSYSAIWRLMNE